MTPCPKYKPSGIAWPGEIPEQDKVLSDQFPGLPDPLGGNVRNYTGIETYLCPNSTRHASRQISVPGRVFCKKSSSAQDNRPPRPLHDAHLGGFLFLAHPTA